jgi:hypothetical protein
LESAHKEWGNMFLGASLDDAEGQTTVPWGYASTLSFGISSDEEDAGPLIGYFKDAYGGKDSGNWALDFSDFTYKVKGMSIGSGIIDTYGVEELVIKSVEFIKK